MRAVDTNVLLRVLVRDDARQAATADAFIAEGAWVSHVVLAELAWVLESSYDRKRSDIAAVIEGLLVSLAVQEPEAVTRSLALYRDRPAVEFADCLILEVARKSGHLPLGTFDRKLAKLEGAKGL